MNAFRNFFRSRQGKEIAERPPRPPMIPKGRRVYAIGDIHGRLDLLMAVGRAIHEDDRSRRSAKTTIIFLGDLIDRGPESAGVIELAQKWAKFADVRFISGNHEELFMQSFGKIDTFRGFLKFGGHETVLSYGVDSDEFAQASIEEAQRMMSAVVPVRHRTFIQGFEKLIEIGDYLFVHAGVNPDVPLESQAGHDCRWIREPFLSHGRWLGRMVIHGHTITDDADIRLNRIGIDTGAFASGKLTALGLEGAERWLIQSGQDGQDIETFATAA